MTEEPNHQQPRVQARLDPSLRLGVDLRLPTEIAKQEGVDPTTVLCMDYQHHDLAIHATS